MAKSKGRRVWLNTDQSQTAFVSWHVCRFGDSDDDDWDAEFKVADCSRIVTLDFAAYGGQGKKDRYKKLLKLMGELERFKAALEAEGYGD